MIVENILDCADYKEVAHFCLDLLYGDHEWRELVKSVEVIPT